MIQCFESPIVLFQTHPSVRVSGQEHDYVPVMCTEPLCPESMIHLHCPFCAQIETYTDLRVLKDHYKKEHVDRCLEYAGKFVQFKLHLLLS